MPIRPSGAGQLRIAWRDRRIHARIERALYEKITYEISTLVMPGNFTSAGKNEP